MSSSPRDVVRAPTEDDVAAIVELFAPRLSDDDEIRGWLRNPHFDVENNFRVAERDRRLAAYADVDPEGDRVSVDWAGALDLLQPWIEGRARELEISRVRTWLWFANDNGDRLMRSLGYVRTKTSFEMRRALDGDTSDAPPLSGGVLVRPPREGEERAVHAVVEDAFADTRDRQPRTFETWLSWVADYERDCWRLAEAGEALVGAAVCRASSPGEPNVGWVEALGVRRSWRQRGIGTALLEAAFAAFRARGCTHAGLSVDSENPTGALRIYERAGMHVHRTSANYEKELS